jgi:hypothetical protein
LGSRLLGTGLFKLRQGLYPGTFISFGGFISKGLRVIPRTVQLSAEVRSSKTMPPAWIAKRLAMGSVGYARWLLYRHGKVM